MQRSWHGEWLDSLPSRFVNELPEDGKLMMGKHSSLKDVNADTLNEVLGKGKFQQIIGDTAFLGMVNWTMLTKLNSIWDLRVLVVYPEGTTVPIVLENKDHVSIPGAPEDL